MAADSLLPLGGAVGRGRSEARRSGGLFRTVLGTCAATVLLRRGPCCVHQDPPGTGEGLFRESRPAPAGSDGVDEAVRLRRLDGGGRRPPGAGNRIPRAGLKNGLPLAEVA